VASTKALKSRTLVSLKAIRLCEPGMDWNFMPRLFSHAMVDDNDAAPCPSPAGEVRIRQKKTHRWRVNNIDGKIHVG
jgi:hypothetical protein